MRLDISQFAAAYNEQGEDIELSEDMLNALDATFTNLENKHCSAIVRFAYDPNFAGTENVHEPSIEMINRHQEQLGPVLSKHAECIVSVELGLFGKWGEMHSGDKCNQENYNKTIDKWLEVLPDSIPISVRTPGHYAGWAGVDRAKLDENVTVKGEDAYRVGIYNDGYLGSYNDLGTYANRDVELSWIDNQAKHTLFGGEIVLNSNSGDVKNTAAYMEKEAFITHTSYLNIEWNYNVINAMKEEVYSGKDPLYAGMTGFEYIRNHLGYRYVVRDVRLTKETTAKENFGIEADIENVGFANIVKDKELILILKNDSNTYYFNTSDIKADGESNPSLNVTAVNDDPTAWNLREKVTFKAVCDLPDDMELGDYKVYLRIADDGESEGLNGYPVRFANADKESNESLESVVSIWEEVLGANYLGKVNITDVTDNPSGVGTTGDNSKGENGENGSVSNTSSEDAASGQTKEPQDKDLGDKESDSQSVTLGNGVKPGKVLSTYSSDGKFSEKVLVTSVDIAKKTGTVTILSLRPNSKKLIINDEYVYYGLPLKITEIADGACKNNKKITSITIGKNVTKIGSKAFYGAKNCKTIKIKSTRLTAKKVGKKAFGNIYKKVKVKVPKKKYKSYKKWLYKKGISKKAKLKKM